MKFIPAWMRRRTIGQIASDQLQDTRLAILEAEANLERTKAELDLLSARESRLANYVEAWAGDQPFAIDAQPMQTASIMSLTKEKL